MRFPLRTTLAAAVFALAACSSNDSSTNSPPPAPSAVTATALSSGSVRLTWTGPANATSYIVQRAAGAAGAFATVASPTTSPFDDAGLTQSTLYRYQVATVIGTDTSAFSAAVSVTTLAFGNAGALLTGNIVASRTLSADTVYTLSGFVKVRTGATLTIPAGTKLVGDTTVAGSSLWITRGGRIDAQGTAALPIIMTSARAPGNRKPGDWGGVIIVGNATANRGSCGANPSCVNTTLTEGPAGGIQNTAENYAGGSDANDNSGTMRYVRIEFAGYAVQANQELNSLSMYAVGRGTTLEYIEAMSGLDDSFEWFGGSVDARHLVSYEAGDDHFDWTEGYNGRVQYMIGLQTYKPTPLAGAGFVSSDPRGFEGDGCENDKAGCPDYFTKPYSGPVFANFTMVGTGPGVFVGVSEGNGAVIRRGSGANLVNGIIARWQGRGLNVRDAASDSLRKVDSLIVTNTLFNENALGNFDPAGTNFGQFANYPNNDSLAVSTSTLFTSLPLPGVEPTTGTLDWSLSAASQARAGGLTTFTGKLQARTAGFFGATLAGTSYRGAADPAGTKWWEGWTAYNRN